MSLAEVPFQGAQFRAGERRLQQHYGEAGLGFRLPPAVTTRTRCSRRERVNEALEKLDTFLLWRVAEVEKGARKEKAKAQLSSE